MLQPASVTLDAHVDPGAAAHGPTEVITIPDAHLLFSGDFKRAGTDLILSDETQRFVVHDYFRGENRPTLVSPEGGRVTGDVVEAFTGHGDYAQAGPAQNTAAVIGRVAKVVGDATIIRNGVSITAHIGDAILKTDVLQTGTGSLVVGFIDGSTVNLTANARLAVNDFNYEQQGTHNSEILNLLQGSLTFISGEVAHTGTMNIESPIATMGIRGTVGGFGQDAWIIEGGPAVLTLNGHVVAQLTPGGGMIHFNLVAPAEYVAQELNKTPEQLAYQLSVLQYMVNMSALAVQINNYFSNGVNPQSLNSNHTQIIIDLSSIQAALNNGPDFIFNPSNLLNIPVVITNTDLTNGDITTYETYLQVPTNVPPFVFAGAFYWISGTDTWFTGDKWTAGTSPTIADDAIIGEDQNGQSVPNADVTSAGPIQANSISLHNGAQLHAADITVAGDILIFGDRIGGDSTPNVTEISVAIGDLTIHDLGGSFLLSATTRNAALIADGNLTIGNIAGDFTIDGSSCYFAVDFAEIAALNGNLTIGNIGDNFFHFGDFTNYGLIEAINGTLSIGTVGGTFLNAGVLQANSIQIAANPGEVLDNEGGLIVEGCGPTSMIYVEVDNSGHIKATHGARLVFDESVANNYCGVIEAKHGGTIEFNNTVCNLGTIVAIACGAEAFYDDVHNYGLIKSAYGGQIDFYDGVHNHDTILANHGGEIDFHAGVHNEDDGLIAAAHSGSIYFDCGTVHNAGIIRAEYSGYIEFDGKVHNGDIIRAQYGGEIDFYGSIHNYDTGSIIANDCGTIGFGCVDNWGLIKANNDGQIGFCDFVYNAGAIESRNGSEIDFRDVVHNSGTILAIDCNSTINFDCGWVDNCGTIRAESDATINFYDSVHNSGDGLIAATDFGYIGFGCVDNCGLIRATYDSQIEFYDTVHNDGTIRSGTDSVIDFHDSVHNTNLIVAADYGTINFDCGWVDNCGTIEANYNGVVDFAHWVGGNGVLGINGGTIELAGGTCNSVNFSGDAGGTLMLDDVTVSTGQIFGFGPGDSVDFANLHDVSLVDFVANGNAGTLDLHSISQGDFSLSFMGDCTSYSLDNFVLTDQASGTYLTEAPVLTLDNPQVTQVDDNGTQVNDLHILEPFAGDDTLIFRAVADHGSLSLNDESGLTVTSDGSNGTFRATGTLDQLNDDLMNGAVYTPFDSVLNGTDQVNDMVKVTVTDSAGAKDVFNLIFNAVNPNNDSITLTGIAQKDFIYASGDNDTLTGKAGDDTFVFGPLHGGGSHDEITDYHPQHDFLDFDSSIFASVTDVLNHAANDGHGNTVITIDANNSILLDGVTYNQLHNNQGHILIA